jgi:hypothetical protein
MEKTQARLGRPDFVWGISGHNCGYAAYPAEFLEQQVRLAAELGVDVYRINTTPTDEAGFDYLDKVVDLCDKYGLKVFLIVFDCCLHDGSQPPEFYYQHVKAIAERYKDRIPMIQISNEQDIPGLDLDTYKDPDGDLPKYYDMQRYPLIRDRMAAMLRAVKEAAPAMERVVNFSWKHYGILDMFLADGLEWDSTAIDWYSNMDDLADVRPILEHLFAMPQKAVYVAEGNHWWGDYLVSEARQVEYLTEAMKRFSSVPNDKMKGYMIYELLDEPAHEWGESHFGLVKNDIRGHIGAPKLAYAAVQKLLRGNAAALDGDSAATQELYNSMFDGQAVIGKTGDRDG